MVDILVIGATGFCGRHAARYILEHPERSKSKYSVGLVARSRVKLTSIGLPIDDSVRIFELDISDEQALESVVKQARVVLNCIGPFWHYGTPVVRACARNGVHYVDITGETPWVYDIIHKFDYLATKTHAIIVPYCGLDSIPSDALVHLASKTLGHAPLAESTTAVWLKGEFPGGTLASFITAMEDVPRHHLTASTRDWALSPVVGARSPGPKFVYRIGKKLCGGYYIFNQGDCALVQRTAGLLQLSRLRSTQAPLPPSYGPKFTYEEFMQTRNVIYAFLLSSTVAVTLATLFFVTPIRWLFKHLVRQPGSGPADCTLEQGSMEYVNVTASDEPTPRYVKTIMRARGDPGTLLTAAFVGESALALLLDKLPPLAAGGGVLTPITAFGDNIVRRLAANDRFEITTKIVSNPDDEIEESRKVR